MSGYALEHNTRKMIINHIMAYPGVSFVIIKKMLNLPEGTLRYHLNYLESKNEIKSTLQGKNRCYYPVQKVVFDSRSDSEIKTHRLSETQERLLSTIRRNPGITQKDLILQTGLKRITVGYNLRKIVDFGVVRKEPNGRKVCYYYISDIELRERIKKRLITKFLNNEIDEQTFLALKKKLG
jgi:predicted transcriptional regulator